MEGEVEAVPVVPAATVILVRDGDQGPEALLLQRAKNLAFHGGAWVFPGGRVDPEDGDFDSDPEAVVRRAALRETLEEAGLLLEDASLVPWAHWTTPPGGTRRFATWFYLAQAPHRGEVAVDDGEIQRHLWLRPAEALERRRTGTLDLTPPTFISLLRLLSASDAADAVRQAQAYPYLRIAPRPVRSGDQLVMLYDGDAAYDQPDRVEDPALVGPRHRLHLGADDWTYLNDLVDTGSAPFGGG